LIKPIRILGPLFVLHMFCLAPLYGQGVLQDERTLKAAFVFNLIKYVEWPNSGNELLIGSIGDPTMGEVLQKLLEGKSVENRTIHILLSPSDQDLQRCNLLYVSESSPRKAKAILDRIHAKSILTVGDSTFFANHGGMIALVRAGEQVQIQVNLDAVQEAQFKISSRLLNLSTILRNGKEVR
jgi:hypothetical protein